MNLKTIAKLAGVSTVTVSNVINGKYHKASKETVERIQKIVEETHYQPSATARSLIMKRSRIIGVVIPNLHPDDGFSVSPYNAQILAYLDRFIRNKGYYMMLHCVLRSADVLPSLTTWNVDGVFLLGVAPEDAAALSQRLSIPTVFVDTYTDEPSLAAIRIDDRKGGYLAGKYLLDQGHRRIAFVSPSTQHPGVMQERYLGFCQAFQERGLSFHQEDKFTVPETMYEQGMKIGETVASRPEITAIAAMADILALGAMEGLRLGGRRVPEDVSVTGFDDLPECRYAYPKLTSISQHLEEKVRCAGEYLFSMLEEQTEASGSRIVDVELIPRESVAKRAPELDSLSQSPNPETEKAAQEKSSQK